MQACINGVDADCQMAAGPMSGCKLLTDVLRVMARVLVLPLLASPAMFAGEVLAVPPPGDTGNSLKLSVDVMGDGLSDMLNQAGNNGVARDSIATPKDPSRKIDLGGVPLTVVAKDSASRGMVAGADGQYTIRLLDNVSLVNRGSFRQTQSLDRSMLGSTAASGGPELLYKNGGTLIGLQPGLGVQLDNTSLDQLSYGVNSRISKDLIGGLNATATTSYALQNAASGDSSIANGSAGLSYTFPTNVKMGLSYVIQKALSSSDNSGTDKQGPALTATVPIGSDLNIGATYAYTRSDSITDLEREKNSAQTVGLTAGWDVGAAINADVKVKAKYDYTRDTSAAPGDKQTQHAATVGMDMKF